MITSKHGPATGGAAPAAAAAAQDDGVTRWTVTRLSLIDALRRGWPDLPLAILARSADTVLSRLKSGTRAEAPASPLLSLAAAFERRADRIGGRGLTRDGTIRARVLREAAAMARRRAQGGQESAHGGGPVPQGAGSGTDRLSDADDDSDLTEDGWPL